MVTRDSEGRLASGSAEIVRMQTRSPRNDKFERLRPSEKIESRGKRSLAEELGGDFGDVLALESGGLEFVRSGMA